MALLEHLEELRRRIITCLAAVFIGILIGFPFAGRILKILKLPAARTIDKLVFFSPQEGFLIYWRISFLAGLILALPVILYQIWAFISPAMERKVRRRAFDFIFFGSLSFILGAAFIYFLLLPQALKFLLTFGQKELEPVISASKYISFVTTLLLAGGLIFQMPILTLFLTKIGLVNWRFLRKRFAYAVVGIFILAAIITPTTDVFNMLFLSIPMVFLYGISILVSFIAKPRAEHKSSQVVTNI